MLPVCPVGLCPLLPADRQAGARPAHLGAQCHGRHCDGRAELVARVADHGAREQLLVLVQHGQLHVLVWRRVGRGALQQRQLAGVAQHQLIHPAHRLQRLHTCTHTHTAAVSCLQRLHTCTHTHSSRVVLLNSLVGLYQRCAFKHLCRQICTWFRSPNTIAKLFLIECRSLPFTANNMKKKNLRIRIMCFIPFVNHNMHHFKSQKVFYYNNLTWVKNYLKAHMFHLIKQRGLNDTVQLSKPKVNLVIPVETHTPYRWWGCVHHTLSLRSERIHIFDHVMLTTSSTHWKNLSLAEAFFFRKTVPTPMPHCYQQVYNFIWWLGIVLALFPVKQDNSVVIPGYFVIPRSRVFIHTNSDSRHLTFNNLDECQANGEWG